jgi:F-type H+-transporting ATPase subunit delta
MRISRQNRREAKELFRSCVADGLLNEERVRQMVQRVLATKPRGYLGILSHFQRLVKLDLDRRTARIESAVQLPDDLQARVRAGLTQLYGAGLYLNFSQDPALIGGMRIKVGSDVYDGSIKGRLAALRESF